MDIQIPNGHCAMYRNWKKIFDCVKLTLGVPQDSVLGPLVCINDIFLTIVQHCKFSLMIAFQ